MLAAVAVAALALGTGAPALAHGYQGPGHGWGWGYGSCPGMGPGMMGPGMMGPGMMGPGMMGPGMMGPGMMGPGMMGPGMGMMGPGGMAALAKDLSVDEVRHMLEHYAAWQGGDGLKVGKVEEKDADTILGEIVTADGSVVQRLQVDRHTGWMSPAP